MNRNIQGLAYLFFFFGGLGKWGDGVSLKFVPGLRVDERTSILREVH